MLSTVPLLPVKTAFDNDETMKVPLFLLTVWLAARVPFSCET